MNPLVSAIIGKALDGLSLRSVATAQNIANANSPGYRPLRVSFEEELAAASMRGETAVGSVLLGMDEVVAPNGQRLDLELATQSETARRYGALVEILSRELSLTRTVIRGGQ